MSILIRTDQIPDMKDMISSGGENVYPVEKRPFRNLNNKDNS